MILFVISFSMLSFLVLVWFSRRVLLKRWRSFTWCSLSTWSALEMHWKRTESTLKEPYSQRLGTVRVTSTWDCDVFSWLWNAVALTWLVRHSYIQNQVSSLSENCLVLPRNYSTGYCANTLFFHYFRWSIRKISSDISSSATLLRVNYLCWLIVPSRPLHIFF